MEYVQESDIDALLAGKVSEQSSEALRDVCKMIPWPEIYRKREFAICKGYRDFKRSCVRFVLDLQSTGRVYILCGEYVGPQVYTVAALQAKRYAATNASTCQLMSLHLAPDDERLIGGVPDQTPVPEIEDAADAAGFVLPTEQKYSSKI